MNIPYDWHELPESVFCEEGPAFIELAIDGRTLLHVATQCGTDYTTIDIGDLVRWLWRNRPELLARRDS